MDDCKSSSELYENIPQGVMPIRFHIHSTPKFRLHWHEHIEIHYVIEGNFIARCENDIVELKEDSFLIVNSNELHEGIGGNCWRFYLILPPTFMKKKNIILKRVIKDEYLSSIAQKMILEHNNRDEFTNSAMEGYAHLFLTHLCRNHVYESIDERSWGSYSQRILGLNHAIKYIHDNYRKEITLDELAKITNFSKYYFCNIFKEFTGESFKDYQNRIRVKKATELLTATDLPITEIAFMCGFNDSNYFSRKFKQMTDKTPREMRNNIK